MSNNFSNLKYFSIFNRGASNDYGIIYGDVDEATNIPSQPIINKAEILLNYNKRSLSPIMEESEDETCKTFVFNNETRNMDSTSTGCVESEAIMGVTKTLMASNDTLFNFEDTLVDENIFSPRAQSQNEERSVLDLIDIPFALKYPLESLPLNVEGNLIQTLDLNDGDKTPIIQRPMDLPPFIERMDVNDLLSPDQEPDLTYTVDEKTFVTVQHNSLKVMADPDDERISEISEPELVSTSSAPDGHQKTEDDDDLTSIEEDLPEEMYRPCEDVAETVVLSDSCDSDSSSASDTTPKADQGPAQDINKPEDDTSHEKQHTNSSETQAIIVDGSITNSSNDSNSSPPYYNENINFLNNEIKHSSQQQERNLSNDRNNTSSVVVKTVTKAMVPDLYNGNNIKSQISNGTDADYWDICDKIYHETVKEKVSNI